MFKTAEVLPANKT